MKDILRRFHGWFGAVFISTLGLLPACGGADPGTIEPSVAEEAPNPDRVREARSAGSGHTLDRQHDVDFTGAIPLCHRATCAPGERCVAWYFDSDQDEFGDATHSVYACESSQPAWYVDNANDCDDQDHDVHPGQTDYFTVARVTGSYDYDCDGDEAPEYPVATGDLCGFVSETACGQIGQLDACTGELEYERQGCR